MSDQSRMERRQKVLADFGEFALRSDDLDAVLTQACHLVAEALGTGEEWLGYGWVNAVHPDDRAYAERQWREAVAARGLVDCEFRLRASDGGWRWINVRAAPVIDAEGRIEKWAGMNIDIHARKHAEAALLESEERQRFLLALGDAMRAEASASGKMEVAARLLGERLKASRIMFAEYDHEKGIADIFYGWFADGAEPFPAVMRLADFEGPILDDLRACSS